MDSFEEYLVMLCRVVNANNIYPVSGYIIRPRDFMRPEMVGSGQTNIMQSVNTYNDTGMVNLTKTDISSYIVSAPNVYGIFVYGR